MGDLKKISDDFQLLPEQINAVNGAKPQRDWRTYHNNNKFDKSKLPQEDDELLFIGERLVGSRGNFVTITGPAKSRKTVLSGGMIAASLSGDMKYNFSVASDDLKIITMDTEQAYGHFYKTSFRNIKHAGFDDIPDNIQMSSCNDLDVKEQLEYLTWLMDQYEPDIAFIDGISDFVADINDNKEISRLRSKLVKLSKKYNSLFVLMIHTTKSTGYMTGALGTMFEKRAETVIKIELDKKQKEVSNVSCQYSRNAAFLPFEIVWNETKGMHEVPEGSKENINAEITELNPLFYNLEHHNKVLKTIFAKKELYQYGELAKKLGKHGTLGGKVFGLTNQKKWFTYYKENELISQINGTWRRNYYGILNSKEDDPCPF